MTQLRSLLLSLSCLLLAVLLSACGHPSKQANILFITLDTTRADRLGCYGFESAATPVLDQLAESGTLFEEAYTCVPLTLPSHTTMFTAMYPPEHGIHANGRQSLSEQVPVLSEILKAKGYRTGAFLASSVLAEDYGLARGFDIYDDVSEMESGLDQSRMLAILEDPQHTPYRKGDEVVASALKWLETISNDEDDGPFFCWIHLYDPHLPGHWHEGIVEKKFDHQYDAEISFMDMQIGKVLDWLKSRDHADNTLVVAVGDHGEGLGENGEESHGFFLYSTLHVPMIFSFPGHVEAGQRVKEQVTTRELTPTILDFLNMDPEVYPRGDVRNGMASRIMDLSFAEGLKGGPIESRPFYAETDLPLINFGWAPLRAYITPEWKYIRAPRPELYDKATLPADTVNEADSRLQLTAELDGELLALEESMVKVQANEVHLSDQEKQRLESLGYMAGGQDVDADADLFSLPDVKDMKDVIEKQSAVRSRLQKNLIDEKTELLCENIVSRSPNTALFHSWLGIIKSHLGKTEEAMASFATALDMAPDGVTVLNNYAIVQLESGRPLQGIASFEKSLQLRPNDERIRLNLAIASSEVGYALGRQGNLAEAVRLLSRSIELRPDNAAVQSNLGIALMGLKRIDEAIAHFEEAIRIDPQYTIARRNLRVAQNAKKQSQH